MPSDKTSTSVLEGDQQLFNHCLSTAEISVRSRQGSAPQDTSIKQRRQTKLDATLSTSTETPTLFQTTEPSTTANLTDGELLDSFLGIKPADNLVVGINLKHKQALDSVRFMLFLVAGLLVRLSFLCSFGIQYVQVSRIQLSLIVSCVCIIIPTVSFWDNIIGYSTDECYIVQVMFSVQFVSDYHVPIHGIGNYISRLHTSCTGGWYSSCIICQGLASEVNSFKP